MRAIVVHEFGQPEVMKLETVPEPTPGAGQVLIRVHAAGVNPVDTYIRAGLYARKPSLPYTPGSDIAGVVERVGSGVSRVRQGDRVYAHAAVGGYAELAVCDEWQVGALPERLSFAQGAAIGVPYGTAWRALFMRAAARPGETVLVHGASGGVGTAAVQIARAHGLHVIGTAGSAELFNATRDDLREIHAGLTAGMETGTLTPVIGKELPLADAPKAHAAVMEPGAFGKIVLVP
jgi:NADPH:quinone reductase